MSWSPWHTLLAALAVVGLVAAGLELAGSPAVPGASDGSSVHVIDPDAWVPLVDEGFDRPAPLGSFAAVYGEAWAGYDGWEDTSRHLGRPDGARGLYDSARTVHVADGVARVHVHTDAGQPYVAALTPTPNGEWWDGQLYGRYEVRFRSDAVPGYKVAWLLWPSSDDWTEGEVDFPEADLGSEIFGYSHQVDGDPTVNQWRVETGATTSEWHTAVIEWTPSRLTYVLDGRAWSTTDRRAIPDTPMRWVLQTETHLEQVPPPASAAGHVSIDYVRAWAWRG